MTGLVCNLSTKPHLLQQHTKIPLAKTTLSKINVVLNNLCNSKMLDSHWYLLRWGKFSRTNW